MKLVSTILTVFLLLLAACQDYDHFDPYETAFARFSFLSNLNPVQFSTTIDPAKAHTLHTSGDILLDIPANAFADRFGNPATGSIQLHFSYLEEPYQLIAQDLSLVTGDQELIDIEAVLSLRAYSESGYALQWAAEKSLRIRIPDDLKDETPGIFYPSGNDEWSGLSGWEVAPGPAYQDGVYTESWSYKDAQGMLVHTQGFVIQTTKVGWVALGKILKEEPLVSACFYLDEKFKPQNTLGYILGNNHKTLQKLSWDKDRHTFCTGVSNIPKGMEGYVLFIVEDDVEKYGLGFQPHTFTRDTSLWIDLQAASAGEIIRQLKEIH